VAFEALRSRASDRDLELIFDHLAKTYQALGDPAGTALERAAARVRAIEDDMEGLGRAPFQGTLREDVLPGLRQVTKHRAVFCFRIDEGAAQVRVLAGFFGGRTTWHKCSAASGTGADRGARAPVR
jgi:toxin ParE1/3/4